MPSWPRSYAASRTTILIIHTLQGAAAQGWRLLQEICGEKGCKCLYWQLLAKASKVHVSSGHSRLKREISRHNATRRHWVNSPVELMYGSLLLLQHTNHNSKKSYSPQQPFHTALVQNPLPTVIDNNVTAHDSRWSTNVRLYYGLVSRWTSTRARHLSLLSYYCCGGRSVGGVCWCGGIVVARRRWGIVGLDSRLCHRDNWDDVQRGRRFAIAVLTCTLVDGRGLLRLIPCWRWWSVVLTCSGSIRAVRATLTGVPRCATRDFSCIVPGAWLTRIAAVLRLTHSRARWLVGSDRSAIKVNCCEEASNAVLSWDQTVVEREQEEEWEVDWSHHSGSLKCAACIRRLIEGQVWPLLFKDSEETCELGASSHELAKREEEWDTRY